MNFAKAFCQITYFRVPRKIGAKPAGETERAAIPARRIGAFEGALVRRSGARQKLRPTHISRIDGHGFVLASMADDGATLSPRRGSVRVTESHRIDLPPARTGGGTTAETMHGRPTPFGISKRARLPDKLPDGGTTMSPPGYQSAGSRHNTGIDCHDELNNQSMKIGLSVTRTLFAYTAQGRSPWHTKYHAETS